MSVYSRRSSSTTPSKRFVKSSADEALFGLNKGATTARGHHSRRESDVQELTQKARTGQALPANAIIISPSDLQRMKNSAAIATKEELMQQRRLLEEQNEKQMAAARAKRQRMIEIEAEKRKNIPVNQADVDEQLRREALQNRAQQLLNEQKDEVKHMNQMVLYAKTVTVRDKQLREKRSMSEQRKVEEKRKDLLMEVDRLKKIKFHEEIERERKILQKKKALDIVDQIKEREIQRMKIQEEKEKEGQEVLKAIRQLQAEETANTMKKIEKQRMLNDEILQENQRAILIKQQRIQEARDEEEKIVQYNREKAQKEAEYVAEQKRIKEEKEREIQRLRALQEKANDRQSEMDDLRARRAVELAERVAREKERKEAEHRAQMNNDLFESRRLQAVEKEFRLQEQAKREKDAFEKIIHQQKAQRDAELRAEEVKKIMVDEHSNQLKKQVAIREEQKLQEKRALLEDGKKIRDKLAYEKKVLEQIKEQKLADLKASGIAEKYTGELARKRIGV